MNCKTSVLLFLVGLGFLESGYGQIFVSNGGNLGVSGGFTTNGSIGEYTTSGATLNASLISELSAPCGLALSGNNLFVASASGGIGEYTTSGTTVNPSLVTGLSHPEGLAVAGNNLYVANLGNGTIGEYTTSGTTVNAALIAGLDQPTGVVVFGTDLFVLDIARGTIGEYTTSGATVNASLVSGLENPPWVPNYEPASPWGLAVDGNGNLIVTVTGGIGGIGKFTPSGATVYLSMIPTLGPTFLTGVAMSGTSLFVANAWSSTIGEYTTSGAAVDTSLISGLNAPNFLVVEDVPEPSSLSLVGLACVVLVSLHRRRVG